MIDFLSTGTIGRDTASEHYMFSKLIKLLTICVDGVVQTRCVGINVEHQWVDIIVDKNSYWMTDSEIELFLKDNPDVHITDEYSPSPLFEKWEKNLFIRRIYGTMKISIQLDTSSD